MKPRFTTLGALLTSAAIITASSVDAHDERRKTELFAPGVAHATDGATASSDAPVRIDGLGSYGMKAALASPEAQAWFEQGIGLLWGFNHAAAAQAFRAGQAADPACAMCYWAEAYALGPNLNDIMHPENEARAQEAARLAAGHARTPQEAAMAQALLLRYAPDVADQGVRNAAFASAISEVAADYPEDVNLQVLKADALMNLQPWDYWEADAVTPKGNGAEILATLERAMALMPDHPAALHLYIHAVEASANPERAIPAADRLQGLAPAAGHLVHMPAHIYNRVGRFADSIALNKAAVTADERFLETAGDGASPLYRYGYYPHNVHFLLVAAQMAGEADEAVAAAEKLAAITSDEVSAQLAWVQAIRTAPYSAHAQFSDPETILALPQPDEAFPFLMGYWHYARGVAHAANGDVAAAREEQQAIERIIAEADLSTLESQYLPARTVLGIAESLVEARICQAMGDLEAAEHHVEAAAALQDEISYMEPPYWYYPVRQTLAAVKLQKGETGAAIAAFDRALEETPNNAWALWGRWQALIADRGDQGDDGEVAAARRAFEKAWLGGEAPLTLDRL